MKRLQSFVGLTLLGGFMVVLPITIFILLVNWLFGLVTALLNPLSNWIASWASFTHYAAQLISILAILCACFVIGLLIRTRIGGWLHDLLDSWLTRLAPGYKTVREVVMQFLGGEGNTSLLKGQVCRAYIHGRAAGVSVTGVITANHANGDYTVYVPTAPIPTSGFVYHLSRDCVDLLPHIGVEAAMRTVIACGSGSQIISDPAPEKE
jgi:uncharacterized membrane protein